MIANADGLTLTDDKSRMDLDVIHGYLCNAYWSVGVPRNIVQKAIANSLCFGVFDQAVQVAFARVVTDYATFAYLADVFVIPDYRGRGISKWMVEAIVNDARLKVVRRFLLFTRDAHGLYEKFGFRQMTMPESAMEIKVENPYRLKR
jgi:GNAT superfamily N-acetyltransferase